MRRRAKTAVPSPSSSISSLKTAHFEKKVGFGLRKTGLKSERFRKKSRFSPGMPDLLSPVVIHS
jgi:hypothetical protein